jgi:hypothetical protein
MKSEEIKFPKIAQELGQMRETDQVERLKESPNWTKIEKQDKKHTARLKQIIAEIGWPTISKVGTTASHTAWLLTQHADLDREFQEQVLRLMNQQDDDEVLKRDVAYLTDRLLVAKELPQRYGTQFYQTRKKDGSIDKCILREVEDPEHLEERRDKMEMEPFEENLARFAEMNHFIVEEIELGNFTDFHKN